MQRATAVRIEIVAIALLAALLAVQHSPIKHRSPEVTNETAVSLNLR